MKRIAVITGTRADYGLLYWLIKALHESSEFQLQLLVCGSHLLPQFGETRKEIEGDGFPIEKLVPFSLVDDGPAAMSLATGEAVCAFSRAYIETLPDMLMVLGDRFEAFAATQAALLMRIPVSHLHGGELTQGAVDDCLRHAMTKLSSLHFVATDEYRHRVIQLGEQPSKVFNVGATGLETLLKEPLLSEAQLLETLPMDHFKDPFFLITYHPETQATNDDDGVEPLLSVLESLPHAQLLVTAPNTDSGGQRLLQRLKEFVDQRKNAYFVESLGRRRYLSCLAFVDCVIGNSSSGVIEVPSFRKPTINIGDRQKGRLAAASVIHVSNREDRIREAISLALSSEFSAVCEGASNPYGQGDTSNQILSVLRDLDWSAFDGGKAFFDVPFEISSNGSR